MQHESQFYIDGQWVNPISKSRRDLINPATEKPFATVAMGSASDLNRAVSAARVAFVSFSSTPINQRIELLKSIDSAFRKREREIAKVVTEEMGMPISLSSSSLLEWCKIHTAATIDILRNFEFAERMKTTMVYKEPIGVVGLITPWNWPIGQIYTKILPALATGCTMVLKPSEITPLDAIILTEILHEAGVPPGVFNLINGEGAVVGDAMARHPGIDMISFTGSTRAGIEITKAAADSVKRVVHELGGKSANILLDDADFETAIPAAIDNCFFINGQACDAGTRLLVSRERYDEAVNRAVDVAKKLVVGPPSNPSTTLGPVANATQYEHVQRMIQAGISEGATLAYGGLGRPDGLDSGYFVRPTVFSDVKPGMTIYREEIFGPVLSIVAYEGLDDAARLANDTVYGLAAHVTGKDTDKVRALSRKLRAGSVYLNSPAWDPYAPFGGYKQSGNGRECGARGFDDFLEIKAVLGYG
ncbi:aldehyde dehydrogenase family protein [Mesorhizobium sp. 43Arga]